MDRIPQSSAACIVKEVVVGSNLESRYAKSSAITRTKEHIMTIKINPNESGSPAGKLADAELHFTDGPLAGLKLIGFSIWSRRGGNGRNVTFPARSYSVNGERRSFAILRPIVDTAAQDDIRERILTAYLEYEERASLVA